MAEKFKEGKMTRKNQNADYHHFKPHWIQGYQPTGKRLDVVNPPQGGAGILTTPEKIVREFRIADHGIRIESVKEKVSKLERAIQIFLIFAVGWGFGYFHHFLTTAR